MEFKLPELGEGVHEGELIKWKIKPGDAVSYDQPLCEIMTDKATIEIPSAFKGKVATINAKEGEVVKVGQVMCTFEGSQTAAASASSAASASAPAHSAPKAAPAASPTPAPAMTASAASMGDLNPATRPLAAPATRRVAREMGVDLASIQGSGPNGRIMKDDVLGHGSSSQSRATPSSSRSTTNRPAMGMGGEERMPFVGLRKKISEKMRLSKDKAAHFTYVEEADVTNLVKLRQQAKEMGTAHGVKITYLPFIMKAMIAALKKYPILNSTLDENNHELVIKHFYNIGLSVQTDDGLIAPVIKDVDHKSVIEIARDIEAVVERARTKKLTMDDLTGGTITLTNVGSIGGLFATPIINFPEVAILGFNKIFKKPVVKTINGKDEIVIRDMTYFSISLDHRIVDGAIGAYFIKELIQYVEEPSLLLLNQ